MSIQQIIFSPHPDDECLMGSLPLALNRKYNYPVTVCPLSLGSLNDRKSPRREELKKALKKLSFSLYEFDQLESFSLRFSLNQDWKNQQKQVTAYLQQVKPAVIYYPHRYDLHPAHQGAFLLIESCLKQIKYNGLSITTEFWFPHRRPNILFQVSDQVMENCLAALRCHKGEITRNPYDQFYPIWLQDTGRRASEMFSQWGGNKLDCKYVQLYQARRWIRGNSRKIAPLVLTGTTLHQMEKLIGQYKE